METSEKQALRPGDLLEHEWIGGGACGEVFAVKDAAGVRMALKMFDHAAVNLGLLEKMTRRLGNGGWPDGVMPVLAAEYHAVAPFRLMPLVADDSEQAVPRPRSLQHRLDEYPGLDSWKLVRALASALAGMHARRVPHGNLKPGNVFIADDGTPLLTDWALGHMPGARLSAFTDAVLYQPPAQLRDPHGYLEEQGYSWDVFAFGVLAFRILTGKFPRCHETFSHVAPMPGETRREGLHADLAKVADNLEAHPVIHWPEQDSGALESGMRSWISRSLELDPAKRQRDMIEVAAGLDAVEKHLNADAERRELMDNARHSAGRTRRALAGMATALIGCLIMTGLWQSARTRHAGESRAMKQQIDAHKIEQEAAEQRAVLAEETLFHERQAWLKRLGASLETGDLLFSWVLEQGRRQLPPLDGRQQRIKQLNERFGKILTDTAEDPDLVEEQARLRLQLAELSLAAGDPAAASSRLEEALNMWSALPMTAPLKLRLGTNTLSLALLKKSAGDPDAAVAFNRAREALATVPRDKVDADRLDHLLALLDLHESELLAARGDESNAREQLMRASQTLNRISERRPDAAILRSELASCHLATADLLDAGDQPGDARRVRQLAIAELRKQLVKSPDDTALIAALAACHGALADAAMLAGDVATAESESREAIQRLDEVLAKRPDDVDAVSGKAAQFGLRAGILRDRGQATEAARQLDEGIRMLEAIRTKAPVNAMAAYRLAQLWWQKGRTAGFSGTRDQEIDLLGRALDLLQSLLAAPQADGPPATQLRRALAYLAGDLGHALQLDNRKDDAARTFSAAILQWEELLKSHPENEEYREGLSWSRQRLEDLR